MQIGNSFNSNMAAMAARDSIRNTNVEANSVIAQQNAEQQKQTSSAQSTSDLDKVNAASNRPDSTVGLNNYQTMVQSQSASGTADVPKSEHSINFLA